MDKESAFSCQKGAFASGRGITCALKGAGMSAKGTFPCQKGVFAGGRAAIYAKKGSPFSLAKKGALCTYQKGVFSDGRGAVSI